MANQSYVGDVGTQIIVDTGEDLIIATKKQIKIKKPDGTTVTKDASISETTKLLYPVVEGDFNQAGEYVVQAYVEYADWKGHGTPAHFNVGALLV